jgi:small subunit ribosomal protein S1
VLEHERREVRQRILDDLEPGKVVEGVISNIVDFGAFVDLDGIDGLIHISELSWSHVNHPSEVLNVGEKVDVKVLEIDRDRQRISLGLKQTQADPWQSVIETYQINDIVPGKVTKVVTFGAFVEIHAGVEGLVHISELADHHVENPREVVNQGDDLEVRIIEIDADRRRLSLSLKRVTPAPDGSTEGAVMSFGGDDDEQADDIASEQVAEIEEAPAAVATELELEAAEAITSGDEPVEAAEPVETEDATDPAEPAESED